MSYPYMTFAKHFVLWKIRTHLTTNIHKAGMVPQEKAGKCLDKSRQTGDKSMKKISLMTTI